MAFRRWHIGLHIQAQCYVAVALQKNRRGWSLQRWWRLPVSPQMTTAERVALLTRWCREFPLNYTLSLGFPASRTLQKTVPRPRLSLRSGERVQWITRTVAQQLEMPQEGLCIDFSPSGGDDYRVTAARQSEIQPLLALIRAAGLTVSSITPDASALQRYLPWLAVQIPGLAWHDGEQWLWATRDDWGYSAALPPGLQTPFDLWMPLSQRQPPLPERDDELAIALALALGGR